MKLIFDFVRSKTEIMNKQILQLNLFPVQIILSIIPLGIGGIVPFHALFKVPTDGCGSFLCASDVPSLTGTITTVGLCALWCQQQTGCQRFNWRLAKHSCEIYLFEPNAYLAADTCAHYMMSVLSGTFNPMPCQYNLKRTVIYLGTGAGSDVDVFLMGGIAHSIRSGCTYIASTSACAIFIATKSLGTSSEYDKYNAWRYGNNKLNWYDGQPGQGTYQNRTAQGTPTVWTTNTFGQPGYQTDNIYGSNYRKVEMLMDCSATVSGWFEFKGFMAENWESDIYNSYGSTCQGTAGGTIPYSSTPNHMARCGYKNVFTWGSSSCTIDNI